MSKLEFFDSQMREARASLQEALVAADRLKLEGSLTEIKRALSHVDSVIYETKIKEQPEFAPYRSLPSSENTQNIEQERQ